MSHLNWTMRALQTVFAITSWPTDLGRYDLGGRVLDVVPIPGHDQTSIARPGCS
jgi:hydroxyacylglutathione hydrolase